MSTVRTHTNCRVCQEPLLAPYLDLGDQPLANALLKQSTDPEDTFPLAVTLCHGCGLSQLTVVVDPAILYADYGFRSGTTAAWRTHALELAEQCGAAGTVVDIAANDGTQLQAFHNHGWRCIGVEPAPMPSVVDVPFYREFFSQSLADRITAEHGPVDLIVAQNVLGHVDDVIGFLTAAASLLAPNGQIVVEAPSVHEMMKAVAFDTIYHEHLSYWSTGPLIEAGKQAGLAVHRVDALNIHGGSRRYWLRHANGESPRPIFELAPDERPYTKFANNVQHRLTHLSHALARVKDEGKRLWAFGASAKGTVLLNALKAHGNTVWPEVILDDTPSKQGRYSPGLHIRTVPVTTLRMLTQPDVILILSWNWKDQIIARCREMGYKGEFLVGMPTVERIPSPV